MSMSESMSTDRESSIPRAVLHKKILDAAQQRPDASMKELADDISGATTSIVRRVLQQYGDPGAETEMDEQGEEVGGTVATDDLSQEDEPTDEEDDSTNAMNGAHSKNSAAKKSDQTEDSDSSSDTVTFRAEQADYNPDSDETTDQTTQREKHSVPNISELTEKQRETLESIQEKPTATQAELAEELGIASATINQRVNSIDGFDWSDRHTFIETLFSNGETTTSEPQETTVEDVSNSPTSATTETTMVNSNMKDERNSIDGVNPDSSTEQYENISGRIDELCSQIETLEQQIETKSSSTGFSDPELAHKVVHACMKSDNITDEEEIQILKNILV